MFTAQTQECKTYLYLCVCLQWTWFSSQAPFIPEWSVPIFHQGHGQLLQAFKRPIHWPLITLFLPRYPVLFSFFASCPCRGPLVNPMDLSQGVSLWPCVSSWLPWPLGCLSPSLSKLSASPSLHLLALVGLAHPLLLGAPKDLILGLLLSSL